MKIEDVLEHLRRTMHELRFSQAYIQRKLGWKGSYISQFFYRYKRMPMEDLLAMLHVMRVPVLKFFEGVAGRRAQHFMAGAGGEESSQARLRLARAWITHTRGIGALESRSPVSEKPHPGEEA